MSEQQPDTQPASEKWTPEERRDLDTYKSRIERLLAVCVDIERWRQEKREP